VIETKTVKALKESVENLKNSAAEYLPADTAEDR